MDTIQLVESSFALVPAGTQVLKIDTVKAMPKAKPTKIEVVFKHTNGGSIKQTYDLKKKLKATDKNPIGLVLFSILARTALGNSAMTEFSLSQDLPKLQGKHIECEIVHSEPNENGNIYANIKKIIRLVKVEEPVQEEVEEEWEDEEDI